MENKDPGKTKFNNEQDVNEGFSGENIAPEQPQLNAEIEIDRDGNRNVVQRARNKDNFTGNDTDSGTPGWNNSESLPHDHTENGARRAVENKDRNADVAANRYPESHPDNHIDRGNMKLDE